MGVGDEKKLNPAGFVDIRVPVSLLDLPHPLVHAAVNGPSMALVLQNVAGPSYRPRRPHEFDFHESGFLLLFDLAGTDIIPRMGIFIKRRCFPVGPYAFIFRNLQSAIKQFLCSPSLLKSLFSWPGCKAVARRQDRRGGEIR
jgi:hypothetical protein